MARPPIDFDDTPDEAFVRMGTTRDEMRERMREMAEYDAGAPPAGSPAPDFEIERLSPPEGQRTGESFRLSAHLADNGRPVALVFGSYT